MKKLAGETAEIIRKVQELAPYREDNQTKTRLPLSLKYTCMKIGVYPRAVKRLAPELYEKWRDTDFHWPFVDEQK
jgi:hypothetical protein